MPPTPRSSTGLRGAVLLVAAVLAIALLASEFAGAHEELLEDRAGLDRDLRTSQRPAPLLLQRSAINRELGDWAGALRDLDRARGLGADPADVERERAEVFLAKGDPAAASRAASAAIDVRPNDGRARTLRAEARMAQGLFQLAADDYGRAIAIEPRRPLDLVCARAEALAHAPGDGHKRAIDALDAEIARRGPTPSLLLTALEYERELGDHRGAFARLNALRDLGWSEAHYGLIAGDVWLDAGVTPEDARRRARESWSAGLDALDRVPPRRRTTRAALRLRTEFEQRLSGGAR